MPDLRNTRVVDIIEALEPQGVTVQAHDPHVDAEEAKIEHNLLLKEEADLKPAHCIILAVAHQFYLDQGWQWIENLLENKRGVVIDAKGVLPREDTPAGITLWRL